MATIRIPNLVGTVDQFRTNIYPDHKEAMQAAEEWFASYNVMSPTNLKAFLNSNRIDLLGAMVYPFSDKKGFRLALDLLLLLVAYDDPFDEDVLMLDENVATKVTNDFVSAITEAAEAETFQLVPNLPPIIMSFQDWIVRLRADSTASTQKRCVDQIVEYALTVKKQTVMRVGNIYPSIKEYLLIRNRTGGVKTSLTMMEVACRIDVPDKVIQNPIIQELLQKSNEIVVWSNDIFSFNREQAKGDYFNLVSIVCIEKQIPVQSAIQYAFVMIKSAIRRWFDLRAQIPKFDPQTDEIVSQYVEAIELLTSGFVHWHEKADRYLGPQESRGEVKNGVVKNALIKILPLEPGSPQMPSEIRYNAHRILTS